MKIKIKNVFYVNLVLIVSFLFIITFVFNKTKKEVVDISSQEQNQEEILSSEKEVELQQQASDLIKTKDFSKCRDINSEMYQKVCINNIALVLADETGNVSYCQKLDGELVSIEYCERSVVMDKSVRDEDIGVCKQANNKNTIIECEDQYYISLAISKNDKSKCNDISDTASKIFCLDNFTFRNGFIENINIEFDCNEFQGTEARQDCETFNKNNHLFGALPQSNNDCFQKYKTQLFLQFICKS